MVPDELDGPQSFAWLVARHVDRTLNSLALVLTVPDLPPETWKASVGHQVYALANLARDIGGIGDLLDKVDGETEVEVEDWLDLFGEAVRTLRHEGVLDKKELVEVDAREFFKSIMGGGEGP